MAGKYGSARTLAGGRPDLWKSENRWFTNLMELPEVAISYLLEESLDRKISSEEGFYFIV